MGRAEAAPGKLGILLMITPLPGSGSGFHGMRKGATCRIRNDAIPNLEAASAGRIIRQLL